MYQEPTAVFTVLLLFIIGYTSYLGFNKPGFTEQYIFDVANIKFQKEYLRFFSSGFLHADWGHFAFNAFTIYSFGSEIELGYGIFYLLVIFILSVIGGNLFAYILHQNHDYRAYGASGGACGIIFASIFLEPGGGVMFFLLPVVIPTPIYAILFILASFYGIKSNRDNIGHDAHLGGAIIGLLVTTILKPSIIFDKPYLYFTVLGLSLFILIYLIKSKPFLASSFNFNTWFNKNRELVRDTIDEKHEEAVDRILQKISEKGINSLNPLEKMTLKLASKKRKLK